jgi:lysyl-tRNA synthetase class 2
MEPYLDPFQTEVRDHLGHKYSAYLITSPEFAMKKLLVGGCEKIYQLGSCFRNDEAFGPYHNPEFTMLEWYRAHSDYNEMISDTITLIQSLVREIHGGQHVTYQGHAYDVSQPEVLTMKQAWQQYAQLDLDVLLEYDALYDICMQREYIQEEQSYSWDDLFFKIFLTEIEPKLGQGRLTVLKDFPAALAALAKKSEADPRYAERFEIYMGGLELCNGFSELTDVHEQRERFTAEHALRQQLGKDMYDIDESFLDALQLGMPESGGNALGVDRLIMLLVDVASIEQVRLFTAQELFN